MDDNRVTYDKIFNDYRKLTGMIATLRLMDNWEHLVIDKQGSLWEIKLEDLKGIFKKRNSEIKDIEIKDEQGLVFKTLRNAKEYLVSLVTNYNHYYAILDKKLEKESDEANKLASEKKKKNKTVMVKNLIWYL